MKKRIENKKIEELALEMLNKTTGSLTVTAITEKLKKEHNIKVSPQVVKRHLENLESKRLIERV